MKTKLKINIAQSILYVIIIIFTLNSCSTAMPSRVYTNGSYGALKNYTAKPEYRDKDTSAVYISGSIALGKNNIDISDDSKTLINANIHKSITRKNFNFFYGAGLTYGNYKFDGPSLIEDFVLPTTKNFYMLNSNIGANLNLPTKKMDWRVIGLELGYNYEFGPYHKTLNEINNANIPEYIAANQDNILYYSLSTEAVFKFKNQEALTLGLFAGDILNKKNDLRESSETTMRGYYVAYRFNKVTLSLLQQFTPQLENNSQRPFDGYDSDRSIKLGLSYQLF